MRCQTRITYLAAIFNTGILVHPAIGKAFLDRHVGAVVLDLLLESSARGGLGEAGVVGEVYISLGGDRGAGVGCDL